MNGPPADPTLAEVFLSWPGYGLLAGFVLLWGLLIGSFLNVCIYRAPFGISVNNPKRSFCFRCGTRIEARDNIPVLSYLLLRGRCRACGARYSPRYAIVEALTGLVFLALFVRYNPPGSESFAWGVLPLMALAAVLVIGTMTDLDHWIFPTRIAVWGWPFMLLAAVPLGWLDPLGLLGSGGPFPAVRLADGPWEERILALILGPREFAIRPSEVLWWEPLANAALGAVLAPAMLWAVGFLGKVLFRKEAMGMGDVYLFIFIGAAIGFPNSVLALMAASVLGSVLGSAHILWRKLKRRGGKPPLMLGEGAAEEVPAEDPEPLWRRLYGAARVVPISPLGRSHLPFIPWIAGGTLVVMLWGYFVP